MYVICFVEKLNFLFFFLSFFLFNTLSKFIGYLVLHWKSQILIVPVNLIMPSQKDSNLPHCYGILKVLLPVDIVLGVVGEVVVNDGGDALDVQPA